MSFAPIALTIPQYENYATYWLKAYSQGTTTPLSMATDATGATTLAKCELDAQGFPITSTSARFIPFINGDYDLWLFPTEVEADADLTANAIQFADNLNADSAGTLRTDLAATTGATLVGFKDTVTNSVATNVSAYLNLKVKGLRATFGGVGNAATSAAADDAALLLAFGSGKIIEIEDGEYHFSSAMKMSAAKQEIHGYGAQTLLKYTGTGTAIDFDGYGWCRMADLFLYSLTGAVGIDVGPDAGRTRFAHWWGLDNVNVYGDTPTFTGAGGTTINGFATAGIQVEQAYYGTAKQSEASWCGVGWAGFYEHNGNTYLGCIGRANTKALVWGATGNASTGSSWIGGEIEGIGTSLIELYDSQSSIFSGVRLELTGAGTHVIVNPGVGQTANYNQFQNVIMEGTSAAYTFGDSVGTDQIISNVISGGRSAGAWTIGSDVTGLMHMGGDIVSHAALVPSSGIYTNNGVRTNIDLTGNLSFTLGITGLTTTPTASTLYERRGSQVYISIPTLNGTSNTTACTLTGIPAEIRPSGNRVCTMRVQDNSVVSLAVGTIDSSGVITLSSDASGSGAFTGSGSKGVLACEINYQIK